MPWEKEKIQEGQLINTVGLQRRCFTPIFLQGKLSYIILLSFSQIAPNIELGQNPHSSFLGQVALTALTSCIQKMILPSCNNFQAFSKQFLPHYIIFNKCNFHFQALIFRAIYLKKKNTKIQECRLSSQNIVTTDISCSPNFQSNDTNSNKVI